MLLLQPIRRPRIWNALIATIVVTTLLGAACGTADDSNTGAAGATATASRTTGTPTTSSGSPTPGSTSTSGGTPVVEAIQHSAGASDLVLRVFTGGGFVAP